MRRVGIAGIERLAKHKEEFGRVGEELGNKQLAEWSLRFDRFKDFLQAFAVKYITEIRSDAKFRNHFQRMCTAIGVDPLSSNKGFWADLLGIGDFYYELGIRIVELGLATRESNGGLLPLTEIRESLRRQKESPGITEEDVLRSIGTLKSLGNGFEVVQIGSTQFLHTIPRESNQDLLLAIQQVQASKRVSEDQIIGSLEWSPERAHRILDQLLEDGLLWIDSQSSPEEYWIFNYQT